MVGTGGVWGSSRYPQIPLNRHGCRGPGLRVFRGKVHTSMKALEKNYAGGDFDEFPVCRGHFDFWVGISREKCPDLNNHSTILLAKRDKNVNFDAGPHCRRQPEIEVPGNYVTPAYTAFSPPTKILIERNYILLSAFRALFCSSYTTVFYKISKPRH